MINSKDIQVKTLTGVSHLIKYDNPDMTLGDLRKIVSALINESGDRIRLINQGKQLSED